jgi:hypothetical protein
VWQVGKQTEVITNYTAACEDVSSVLAHIKKVKLTRGKNQSAVTKLADDIAKEYPYFPATLRITAALSGFHAPQGKLPVAKSDLCMEEKVFRIVRSFARHGFTTYNTLVKKQSKQASLAEVENRIYMLLYVWKYGIPVTISTEDGAYAENMHLIPDHTRRIVGSNNVKIETFVAAAYADRNTPVRLTYGSPWKPQTKNAYTIYKGVELYV